MRYLIGQRIILTDLYIVEASSEKEALQIYDETKGSLSSLGSASGWPYGEEKVVVIGEQVTEE